MTPDNPCAYSVVVPFYNEAETAGLLLAEIHEAMEDAVAAGTTYEVILVDDGSVDETRPVLERACAGRAAWKVLPFAQNRGQAAALYFGMKAARGAILILLDGDGQNDPADIGKMLGKLGAGADMVVGVRANRQDSWLRKRMSRLANAVRAWILRDGVSDSGCGLKVMRRDVVEAFIPIRTLYSFMPALAVAAGFRVAEIPVSHRPRKGGASKYGLRAFFWRPVLDMLGVWWFTRRRCPIPGHIAEP